MKNLKRLSAAVLIVALVLTSMTAVFAADAGTVANADKAATLKDLGLYTGQDENDPKVGLENALTTQDSLIFLAKLFGYNDAANALSADQVSQALAKFDDAASISDYAKNVVAYSATNSILSGMTDGQNFFVGAKDTVTAARFATFMLKQMGITVADYKESVAKLAETKGSKVDATVTGDLTRDAAVGVMYGALTAEKASGKTVIADIVGDNADLKAKAEKLGLLDATVTTTDVVVESVKAINCKQIQVVFNQEMDKDSVESEEFYEIQDKSSNKVELGESSASLGDDGKTVTITLNKNVSDKLTNSSEAKVIVKKDIKAKSGTKLAKNATFDKVEVEDGITPTVREVKATGESFIRITFSEPVYDKGDDNIINTANFKVESGTYQYFVSKATLNNNVIDLVVGTKLIEGPVTVTVNNAGPDKDDCIRDYAGYALFKGATTFNYVKDTSVSVITVKSAKPDKVVLHFSKPIKGTDIKLYHSAKNAESYKAIADTKDLFKDEITFTYDSDTQKKLPSGTVNLFLVNSGVDDYKLVDGYGIKVPDQTLTCEIVVDETAPVFTKGDFDKNVKIWLTFDEELDWDFAKNTGNYEIKKVIDNTVISFSAEKDPDKDKTVTLKPNPKLYDNTEYQVTIKKARDIEGNETTKSYTYTFKTGDNNAPVVMDDPKINPHCSAIAQDGKITIVFSEPMNEAQMLDKANYMVSIDEGKKYKPLGDDDSLTKVNDRTITIYIKELDNKNDPTINIYVKIAPIMDLANKRLYGSVNAHTVYLIGADQVDVTVKSAKENRVVLGFSKPVKGSNIRLYHTDKNVESYKATASTSGYLDEITFYFSNSLPSGNINLYLVNSETESQKLIDRDGVYVPDQSLTCNVEEKPKPAPDPAPSSSAPSDTTAPVVTGYTVKGIESITITFNERLDRATAIDPASYAVKRLSDNQEVLFTPELAASRNSVELIFDPKLDDDTEYQLLIKKYKDTSGNMNPADYETTFSTLVPDICQATLTARNQITVLFNTKMASIDKNDFIVSSTTPGAINVVSCEPPTVNDDGITEVVLNLDNDIATDAKDEEGNTIYIGTVADPASVSDSGAKLKGQSQIELFDNGGPGGPGDPGDNVPPDILAIIAGEEYLGYFDLFENRSIVPANTPVTMIVMFSEAVMITEQEHALEIFDVNGFTVTGVDFADENMNLILTVEAINDGTDYEAYVYVSEDHAQYLCDVAGGNALVYNPNLYWQVISSMPK